MDYIDVLRLIHVGGAIAGFGPTFAFSVLGPMAQAAGPNGGVPIMETMVAIEKRLVWPVALVTQPVTGVLMIFKLNYDSDFFSQEWLVTGIVLYVVALYIALFQNTPTIEKMIHLGKAGEGGTPQFEKLGKKAAQFGMLLTLLLIAIIFLMIVQPGR